MFLVTSQNIRNVKFSIRIRLDKFLKIKLAVPSNYLGSGALRGR